MKRRNTYMAFLLLMMLLLGGVINSARAYTVKYHILTMPFTTKKLSNGEGSPVVNHRENIRVEAFYVVVEDATTVGLPAQYKSPLAKNFRYYQGTTTGENGKVSISPNRVQIYDYNTTTFYTYTIEGTTNNADVEFYTNPYSGTLLVPGSAITEDCEIYVTYEYDPSNTIADLRGEKSYNVKLGDRFLAFNKARANRPAAILASNVTEENLNSDDFTYVTNIGFTNTNNDHYFHFRFKLEGPDVNTPDPYNITIRTAYTGDETFYSDVDKILGDKTNVLKYYKGSSLFCKGSDNGKENMWMSSDDDYRYTQTNKNGPVVRIDRPGYYRGGTNGSSEMNPIWNSFAILPALNGEGYVIMGTKINGNGNNWQPKKDGNNYKFFFLTGNIESGKNPRMQLKTHGGAESTPQEPYEVRIYTYKVETPFSNTPLEATVNMTEYIGNASLLTHVPAMLKRKYVQFTKAYKSNTYTDDNLIETFDDVEAANNGRVIWLKYDSSDMPFEALPVGGSYANARWYTIRMHGDQESQHMVYYDTEHGNTFSTGLSHNTNTHQGEDQGTKTQVAFVGDPFGLKIISHAASEAIQTPANRYLGCADPNSSTLFTALAEESSGKYIWEIPFDDTEGSIVLREYGTYGNDAKYIGWASGDTNKPIVYSGTASRIKVMELEKKTYVYHIYNSAGVIAVKASDQQDIGKPLSISTIPEIIFSPFLRVPGVTVKFYYTTAAAEAATTQNYGDCQDHAPFNVTENANKDIYVRYFGMAAALDNPGASRVTFKDDQNWNVQLNSQFLYYSEGGINTQSGITNEQKTQSPYVWKLIGQDPYAMKIYNEGAHVATQSDYKDYIHTTFGNREALLFDAGSNASLFIAKQGSDESTFEVMAATGDTLDVTTQRYYNIGRNNPNSVLMYRNDVYPHSYDQLQFVLTPTNSTAVTYHLIDEAENELLQVVNQDVRLYFPPEYRSPLVAEYTYYATEADAKAKTNAIDAIGGRSDIYVRYTTNTRVNLKKGALYLLKFANGDSFRQENGSNGLTTSAVKAIYPYCNGDCNFFMYGEAEYELQQQGAASTRTRWAWYLESANNDPYHVKICSRQEETFNNVQNQAYFYTFVQNVGGVDKVLTSLCWPGITGVQGTEYMVLGSVGNYKLVTTQKLTVSAVADHQTVKSFEQYWKTYDTIKKILLSDILEEDDKSDDPEGSPTVPNDPSSYRTRLTGTGEGQYGFHSYGYWAYAKRFNGYNSSGATSKGWEQIEHWYQTINMGEGYFDFVSTVIAPVLILLDQHGWEIMRKPLPSSDKDVYKEQKKDALRAYDSPMVKEYYYWSSAKKRSGFHQYYQLEKRIGGDYTSTSLGDLPPWGSENVLDAKGNQNDEYVTYTVKDEYVQSYSVSYTTATAKDANNNDYTKITGVIGTGVPFLIQQGEKVATAPNNSSITTYLVPSGMQQYILDNIATLTNDATKNNYLWYLKPNIDIDIEMGYNDPAVSGSVTWVNDYRDQSKVKTSGFNSWAFDPYNIQISSAAYPTKYFVTNATGATLEEGDGAILGQYGGGNPSMTLGDKKTEVTCIWYDGRKLDITNATFMVVKDEDGNMQLMPRFDQTRRVRDFMTLVTPTAEVDDPNKLPQTHTIFFRPMVYNYHIIDNAGNESLRYQSGGDLTPQIPEHFKSPLAKDFKFYQESTCTNEITESFAKVGKTEATNDVYVRYAYNEHADVQNILKGKWFTMKLNAKDAKYVDGIKEGENKPSPIADNEGDKYWQWKFLETPMTDPDPYAACMFNRYYNGLSGEGWTNKDTPLLNTRFAILPHTGYSDNNRVYALAVAGTGGYTYQFLNGRDMTTSVAATLAEDKASGEGAQSGFKSTSCSFHGTDSQVELIDDVLHVYKYKVYTYDNELAMEADQTFGDAFDNDFEPELPDAAQSPLMKLDDFRYYYTNDVFNNNRIVTVTQAIKDRFPDLTIGQEIPDTIDKGLKYMYGLYDDVVYVHYMPYDANQSSYLIPNVKTIDEGHVARGNGSHDAPIGLDGRQLFNIIWYNDNMMYNDGNNIKGKANQDLKADPTSYVWLLEGDDPYAFKIKSYGASTNETPMYIGSSGTLSATPQKFMLIPQDGYGYGVIAVTGNKANKLTMAADNADPAIDEAVSIAETESPTAFLFFGLATHKVIYHLVIANSYYDGDQSHAANQTETIPYWNGSEITTKAIKGSTQRDLASVNTGDGTHYPGEKYQLGETINGQTYSHDAGIISLGDKLVVPSVFYRPNVVYQFFVEGVYSDGTCNTPVDAMNTLYKGREVTNMGDDPGLLNQTIRINIVYSFNGSLETNAGADFVRSVDQNKWYTFEAKKNDGTPLLTQYTNAWGTEVKEGLGTHYTNDYLWTPLGDPYGFKMFHRYTCVNSGEWNNGEPNRVMTTIDSTLIDPSYRGAFVENKPITMGSNTYAHDDPDHPDPYSVYELLEGDSPGYFKIHPVANMHDATQYYFKIIHDKESPSSAVYHDYLRLSANGYTQFTYGLSEELMRPYYERAGYVGGLKDECKAAYKTASDAGDLITLQSIVYDPNNIVKYTPGYYRLHSPEDIEVDGLKINPVRYASGYTHKTELTDAVPMHFYEVEGSSTQFNLLKSKDGARIDEGYTSSNATRGDIPIPAVEYDPASIFRFYQVPWDTSQGNPEGVYKNNANIAILSTQGLYLKGSKGPGNTEGVDERAKVIMTASETEATPLFIMDIGGGILLIHDQQTANRRGYLKYLSYDQVEANHIYDLKLTHNTHTDHAKWLMQPANHLGLRVTTHSGGDGGTYGGTTYNYTTFYAPFDVMLPDTVFNKDKPTQIDKIYHAVVLDSKNSPWDPENDDLHPKSIGRYNIEANGCPSKIVDGNELFCTNDRFIPAGTPVLIAMHDNAGYVKLTLPNSAPTLKNGSPLLTSSSETYETDGFISSKDDLGKRYNILSGQYLEQKLTLSSTERIYAFGLPFNGTMTLNPSTGDISATLPLQDNAGMGFYLNANPNKELGLSRGDWTRNNWYVYNNKVYYRSSGESGARQQGRGDIQYVPVNFDDYEGDVEQDGIKEQTVGDNRVYDLLGRCVATEEQVKDGTWKQNLRPGIYILNGRKIRK